MLSIQEKVRHAVAFHSAARNPQVASLLSRVGYSEAVAAEGARYLYKTVQVRIGAPPGVADRDLIERTEAYQSFWFPVVRAVLARGYPEFGSLFFEKLTQLEGNEAALSLARFLDKLRKLGAGEAPFGPLGAEARELLVKRSLTAEVEAEGHSLLEERSRLATVEEIDTNEYREAVEAAWNWYCEWRDLARVVIKSRRLLRALGLGRRTAPGGEEEEFEDGEEDSEGAEAPELESTPVPELSSGPAASVSSNDEKEGAAE